MVTRGVSKINTAIVDDLVSEREALKNLLKQYEKEERQPIQIEEFHSGEAMLCGYIPGKFDVVFLDIFLGSENGVDCALKLRQLDENVPIIFLTTSAEFGVKSYDVRATDYIVKPATAENLARALRYCIPKNSQMEPVIAVTARHQPLEIAVDNIFYADFQNRTACIHVEDGLVPVSGSFTELAEQLTAHPQFMACFKGIVVNLKNVREIFGDCLVLKNGERLPVSRRLQRQVQQRRLSLSAGLLRGNWP